MLFASQSKGEQDHLGSACEFLSIELNQKEVRLDVMVLDGSVSCVSYAIFEQTGQNWKLTSQR